MPAADLPPNQPQPESNESESSSTAPGSQHKPDEEWQTVDFPHAMSVDQLPVTESADPESTPSPKIPSTPSFLEIAPQVQPEPDQSLERENSTEFIQALHECNQDLVERITELEAELDECQKVLREKDVFLNQRTQELALAQEQVTRLFGKQELSNQVIQRQQVLVETLTQQWEASQTKMAQIERDCALTQQRHNEQFHELMQTQNTCRELRSRLHRQQRHTLQFKAALERCLEMQPRFEPQNRKPILSQPELITNSASSPEAEPLPTEPVETVQPRSLSGLKAPPVQPWSIQSTIEEESVEPLEEMIQAQEENPFYSQPLEDIVSEATEPLTEVTIDSQPQTELSPSLEELETYWHVEPSPDAVESQQETVSFNVEEWPQPQFMEDELERIRAEYASLSANDPELLMLESFPKSFTQEESESFLIDIDAQPQPQPPEQTEQLNIPIPQQTAVVVDSSSNWPAPLIRPQHRRKLQSLASIELPKLPKPSHSTPESDSVQVQEFAEIEPF